MATGSPNNVPQDDERLMRRRPNLQPEVAESWYYDAQGQIIGPLSGQELLDRVRAGEVTVETLVKKGDSQWVKAGDVNGLFEAAFRRQTYYQCPYCGAEVDKPPTVCLGCDREITAVYRVTQRPSPPVRRTNALPESEQSGSGGGNSAESGQPLVRERATVVHALIQWIRSWVVR